MTNPYGIRRLPFPLNYRTELLQNDTINFVAGNPEDATDCSWFVYQLTNENRLKLTSAMLAGLDLLYPDEFVSLFQLWLQPLEFPDQFPPIATGCTMPDLCDLILNCIETTQELQDAISFYSASSNIQGSSPESETNLAGQLIDNPIGCDNDIIFGMTTQLVEFADRLIKDLFERIDASQLSATNVGYLLKLIPVVETLPLDEMFELTDKLVDDMETAYLSASTQLLKDEIACDLFCLAQDNDCQLTLEMVRDYFEDKVGQVFDYTDVLSFLGDFINGTFVGNAVYYGMNILFFQIFAFGGKFLEYFFQDYLQIIQSMFNDPNSDWSTLCDACPDVWTWNSDFATSQNIWSGMNIGYGAGATYSSGWQSVDIQNGGAPAYSRLINITTGEFTPTRITRVLLTYDLTKGNWQPAFDGTAQVLIQCIKNNDTTVTEFLLNANTVNGSGQTLELILDEPDIKEIWVRVASSRWNNTSNYSGAVGLPAITVEGDGDNPFA